jgi:hypothetical protein
MVTAPIKALATIIRQAGLDTFPKLQPGRPRREVGTGGSHSDAGIDRSKILSDKSGLEFCGLTPHHTEVRAKRKNPISMMSPKLPNVRRPLPRGRMQIWWDSGVA